MNKNNIDGKHSHDEDAASYIHAADHDGIDLRGHILNHHHDEAGLGVAFIHDPKYPKKLDSKLDDGIPVSAAIAENADMVDLSLSTRKHVKGSVDNDATFVSHVGKKNKSIIGEVVGKLRASGIRGDINIDTDVLDASGTNTCVSA